MTKYRFRDKPDVPEKLYCVVTARRSGDDAEIAAPFLREIEARAYCSTYNELSGDRRAEMVELEPPKLPDLPFSSAKRR